MINRLSLAIATREIDLQEELLRLLQRLLVRPIAPAQSSRKSSSASATEKHDLAEADQQNSALLLQAVHSGITNQYNSDILASWLEFSIILGNSLPISLRPLLFPLIDVLSSEIRQLSSDILQLSESMDASGGKEDNLILLLQTVDSLVHYTLGDGFNKGNVKLSRPSVAPVETSGLLGYVFSSTTVENEITNIENGLVGRPFLAHCFFYDTDKSHRSAQNCRPREHAIGNLPPYKHLPAMQPDVRVARGEADTRQSGELLPSSSPRVLGERD